MSTTPSTGHDDRSLHDLRKEREHSHTRAVESVTEALRTRLDHGLDSAEADARLKVFDYNELKEAPRPGFLKMLIDQFNNFVVIVLIVASVLSALLGEWVDAAAIMAIVLLNAILGVVQERKAEEALAALRKMAAPEAHVQRDGQRKTIPSREVVLGDIVFLEAGNYVPADMRLVDTVNLKIDESSLTGESVATEKRADLVLQREIPIGDRHNTAYMSTMVTYGRGKGVVVGTGMHTEIGMIAQMISSYEEEPTPLQQRLDQLGQQLSIGALLVCALVFVAGVFETNVGMIATAGIGAYVTQHANQLVEFFLIAVSLAIAAVPEGLPAVVTITLALGMGEMIRRHALIRKLPAVETLGSATTIASDKTGTLTQNEMTVTSVWADDDTYMVSGQGYQPNGRLIEDGGPLDAPQDKPALYLLLHAALLCNDSILEPSGESESERTYRAVGDPTEAALTVVAAKAGLWREAVERCLPRVAEVPFDSDRKRMTTIHALKQAPPGLGQLILAEEGEFVAFVKGAPDIVLEECTHVLDGGEIVPLGDALRAHIAEHNVDMARQALRVLGCAYRPLRALPGDVSAEQVERELIFAGLLGMRDPARPEVPPAIAKARLAGLRTIMVTGDYPDTARAIASEIGLLRPGAQVMTGAQIQAASDEEFKRAVQNTDVFARVSPEHKVRIVEALKANGEVVAMTGDGVNDAPALKRANIGVAMGIAGTDVSKQTADMVLTDDNYASIVSAIEQGRIIYSNIRKFVFYLLSCNVAEICIIFFATLLGLPSPLTAIQLLWLNLLTDGAPALALGMEKGDPDIMDRPPRPVTEPVVNRTMLIQIAVMTLVLTASVFVSYFAGLAKSKELAETMAFVTLAGAELPIAYTARSERFALLRLGVFGNKWMQYAVSLSILLLLAVVYVPFLQAPFNTVPLGLDHWAVVLPMIFTPAIVAEITKWVLRRSASRTEASGGKEAQRPSG